MESLLSYLHPAPQNFASKNVFEHCTDRTKQSCGAFFGGEPSTPVLCSIFWRLAITCSRPESLTPQLHIYQSWNYIRSPMLVCLYYCVPYMNQPTFFFQPKVGSPVVLCKQYHNSSSKLSQYHWTLQANAIPKEYISVRQPSQVPQPPGS